MVPGQAHIVITQSKIPACPDSTPMTLVNTKVGVNKQFWNSYSGFRKIVLDSPALIDLEFASSETDNSKTICVRNAIIKAIKIK